MADKSRSDRLAELLTELKWTGPLGWRSGSTDIGTREVLRLGEDLLGCEDEVLRRARGIASTAQQVIVAIEERRGAINSLGQLQSEGTIFDAYVARLYEKRAALANTIQLVLALPRGIDQ